MALRAKLSPPKLMFGLLAVALLGAGIWLWPGDGSKPLAAWVPGERGLRGALVRVSAATSDVRLVGTHAPNILILQSDAPYFPLKLLAQGAIPFSLGASDAVCRN